VRCVRRANEGRWQRRCAAARADWFQPSEIL
jgi:hypothetical protein